MSYQEELRAKLDAAHGHSVKEEAQKINTSTLQEQLITEIESEFELSQYDLDESDILRSIKILDILTTYGKAFSHHRALAIFYALARVDVISAKDLLKLSRLKSDDFKCIINAMAKERLLRVNDDKELELTLQGQSLAERIGFDVFI